MSKDDSPATRSRLDALVLTRRAGSAILQRAVAGGRLMAGCPSGQRERSVKPSAQPTLVRTQHLPPAANMPSELDRPGSGLILPCAAACGSGCPCAARCAKYVPKFGALRASSSTRHPWDG